MTDYAQQTRSVNAIDDETITAEQRIICYDQPIYDDKQLEGEEWFGLGVTLVNVLFVYNETAVVIQDNDSMYVTKITTCILVELVMHVHVYQPDHHTGIVMCSVLS